MIPTNQPVLKAGFHKMRQFIDVANAKDEEKKKTKWGNKQLISKNQSSI